MVLRQIRSIKERLPLYAERIGSQRVAQPARTFGEQVFLIHGHNDGRKQEVARTVRQLTGAEPIILHEMPNGGRTVIEKFEDYASAAGFAIALLTADDHGAEAASERLRLRARQNVVFELGFFYGALGRGRVVALADENVEHPSDVAGVIYLRLSDSNWKVELARELREAGIAADTNQLL